MRKVVVTEFVTLDGVMEEPAWTFPYWNDEIAAFKGEETEASDALLLGRVTYEMFAQVWPTRGAEEPGAAWMNAVPKFVATTTLTEMTWNAQKIEGDVVAGVRALKAMPGKNLLVYGSAMLVETLLRGNLVDEYRLLVYPLVKGRGKRLFKDGSEATLQPVESKVFSSGVVALVYKPVVGE